jgi:hypothetical protein
MLGRRIARDAAGSAGDRFGVAHPVQPIRIQMQGEESGIAGCFPERHRLGDAEGKHGHRDRQREHADGDEELQGGQQLWRYARRFRRFWILDIL